MEGKCFEDSKIRGQEIYNKRIFYGHKLPQFRYEAREYIINLLQNSWSSPKVILQCQRSIGKNQALLVLYLHNVTIKC
jgi:hypothetical protein